MGVHAQGCVGVHAQGCAWTGAHARAHVLGAHTRTCVRGWMCKGAWGVHAQGAHMGCTYMVGACKRVLMADACATVCV